MQNGPTEKTVKMPKYHHAVCEDLFSQTLHCLIDLAVIIKLRHRRESIRRWTSAAAGKPYELPAVCLCYAPEEPCDNLIWTKNQSLFVLYFSLYHKLYFSKGQSGDVGVSIPFLRLCKAYIPAAAVSRSSFALWLSFNINQ